MSTNVLDIAWNEINALGGVPCCSHDHVYNAALKDALRVIERLGGRDPLMRNRRQPTEGLRAENVLPLATLATLNGDDPTAHARTSPGPVNCNIRMRYQGEPYPVVCERCYVTNLPCPFFNDDGSKRAFVNALNGDDPEAA